MCRKYHIAIGFIEPILGSVAKNEEIYKTWIASKQEAKGDEGTPEFTEEKSWTGFYKDEILGLYVLDYQIKGYFKHVASVMPETLGLLKRSGESVSGRMARGRLDDWLFIQPRRVYLGKMNPDGYIERPIRAETLRGPRICLGRSDKVDNCKIEFDVVVLDKCPIDETMMRTWLDYGQMQGMFQWRSGGYGRFGYHLVAV